MEKILKLSEWAKQKGLKYNVAARLFRQGQIEGAYKNEAGSIMVKVKSKKPKHSVGYIRVEPAEPQESVDLKVQKFKNIYKEKELEIDELIIEKSGIIDSRKPKLLKLLTEKKVTQLIILDIDEISLFGIEYVELLCKDMECELISLDQLTVNIKYVSKIFKAVAHFFERKY